MEEPVNYPAERENNPTVAHEGTDADAHAITKFGIGLTLVVVVSQLALWWLFSHLSQREQKLSPPVSAIIKAQAPKEPPEPRLQGNPQLDMRKMRQEEDAVLNHYGWVDPDRGIVRLPIQRAIDMAAQKGLPQFKATGDGSGSPPAAKPQSSR
jgi:hypothetical protein